MMKIVLGLIAIISFGYGLTLFPEAASLVADQRTTVMHQISLRLAIGLSLIAFILSVGIAAICHGIDGLRDELSRRPVASAGLAPLPMPPSAPGYSGEATVFTGKTTDELRRERAAAASANPPADDASPDRMRIGNFWVKT